MNNRYLLFIVIGLLAGTVTYIALDNYFYAIGVLLVYALVGVFVLNPILKKHSTKVKKYHECYHFINNFVIALSIKKSIAGSLESTVNSMPNDFIDIYNGLESMNDKEKLDYLSTYFPFYVYHLFLQIVNLWEENGGDIIRMSKYLIAETRYNEEYISKCESMSSHKYVEIGVLWGFCALIVVVLRFSLKEFYDKIKTQILYIVAILILFAFILFTIYLLIQKATNLKIKGYSDNEKEF